VGAEELVPILCFVIVKANISSLYSELQLLGDFIEQSAMIGEVGYVLASFQTCVEYLLQFKPIENTSSLEEEGEEVTISPEEEELLNMQLEQYLKQ
jgi:hypothetical protein